MYDGEDRLEGDEVKVMNAGDELEGHDDDLNDGLEAHEEEEDDDMEKDIEVERYARNAH